MAMNEFQREVVGRLSSLDTTMGSLVGEVKDLRENGCMVGVALKAKTETSFVHIEQDSKAQWGVINHLRNRRNGRNTQNGGDISIRFPVKRVAAIISGVLAGLGAGGVGIWRLFVWLG